MNNLGGFLNKYVHLIGASEKTKKIIVAEINNILKTKLNISQIKISKNIIRVTAPSSIKADIFINKNKIIQSIKGRLDNFIILDIK
ncbi:MAG: hypothetical protein AAB821_00975 [Patescibacteria group bacterium]